jgi:heat-inducible transcriptional repressor
VEKELEKWLSLAATLLAQQVQNIAVVTMPKSTDCRLKHVELVALQDSLALVVLVLHGAKLKQQLVLFEQIVSQPELAAMANKLNENYSGLTRQKILAEDTILSSTEKQLADLLIKMMRDEDVREYAEPYLDGLHFILNQPEFTRSQNMLGLMELVEHRNLLPTIAPKKLESQQVRVIIGKEHQDKTFHNYSLVISKYGIPEEAEGTVSVLGPTRMPYAHTISTVGYLASLLSGLVAVLYSKEPADHGQS